MGFTGFDDFINQITVNDKKQSLFFNKTIYTSATSVAGRWHELLSQLGTGGQMTLTGTAGAGVACAAATAGALPLNGNVSPATKHLIQLAASTGSTTAVPAWLMLTDIIHIYPSCVLTGTPTTLSNHPVWTGVGDERMSNANGVMCSLIETTASTAGNGLIVPTYKDQDGNDQAASRGLMAPATATPIGALWGETGTVVTVGGPFMALAAGDVGVRQINSYAITTGATSGVGAFILHRPVAMIPLALANVVGERDFVTGLPLFPRIHDNACLGMFILVGGAYAAGGVVTGQLTYGWGG